MIVFTVAGMPSIRTAIEAQPTKRKEVYMVILRMTKKAILS
jgi:hypothetical protein